MSEVFVATEKNTPDESEQSIMDLEMNVRGRIAEEGLKCNKELQPFCYQCANEDLVRGLKEIDESFKNASIYGTINQKVKIELDYDKYKKLKLIETIPRIADKMVTTKSGEIIKAKIPVAYFEHYKCDKGHKLSLELDPNQYEEKNKGKDTKAKI